MPETPSPITESGVIVTESASEAFSPRKLWRRLAQGELGSIRVLFGIVIIWTIFTILNERFLTTGNITNLFLQLAAVATISIGVVFVLLLGEIDLSVGAVSGVSAAVMAVLVFRHDWSGPAAIAAALATGAAIGLLQGGLITIFRIPAFVVTLAGSLAWLGLLLFVLGESGTVNVTNTTIIDLTSYRFSPLVGWLIAAVVVVGLAVLSYLRRSRRVRGGLIVQPLAVDVIKIVGAAIAISAVMFMFNDKPDTGFGRYGLPLALAILVALVVLFEYIVKRTRFGRHVLAVGGNAEAARRAGIKVQGIRLAVFTIASTLAAAGGILAASRLFAVNQNSGGSDTLLNAIAGPVIAGTSLYGGRGSIWSALLGAIVITSIANGMNLLGLESSVKYMITGGVLMLAVTIDSLAQRNRRGTGKD